MATEANCRLSVITSFLITLFVALMLIIEYCTFIINCRAVQISLRGTVQYNTNYLLTYDSYVPLYNRFHRVSGGEGALDTPGPLNGTV